MGQIKPSVIKLWFVMWLKPREAFPEILSGDYWKSTVMLGVVTQLYFVLIEFCIELLKLPAAVRASKFSESFGFYSLGFFMVSACTAFFVYCGAIKLLVTLHHKSILFKDIVKAVVWSGSPLAVSFILTVFLLLRVIHPAPSGGDIFSALVICAQVILVLWSFLLSLDCVEIACAIYSRWSAFCVIFISAFFTKIISAILSALLGMLFK